MVCFIAPDGTPQLNVCGSDMAECLGYHQLLVQTGMMMGLDELYKKGFKLAQVKVTVVQTGDDELAFQKTKRKYGH